MNEMTSIGKALAHFRRTQSEVVARRWDCVGPLMFAGEKSIIYLFPAPAPVAPGCDQILTCHATLGAFVERFCRAPHGHWHSVAVGCRRRDGVIM